MRHVEPVPYDHPEVQQLVEAVQAEYVQRYGGPDETPVEPTEFGPPRGTFLLGRDDDGTPVAMGGLRRHDQDTCELKRMFVLPSARGRGHARTLLAALESAAIALGYRRLVLETGLAQPEAVALYESAGYDRIPGFGHYRDSPGNRCYAKDLARRPPPTIAA